MSKNKHYIVEAIFATKRGTEIVWRSRFTNKREAIAKAADYFNVANGFIGGTKLIDTSLANRGWLVFPTVTRIEYGQPVDEFVVDGKTSPIWTDIYTPLPF